MAAVTFKGFRGAVPRAGERLQLPRYAKSARNIKITSGNVVPLRGMLLSTTTLAESIKTIWRYRHITNSVTQDNWLTYAEDTDVVGSLIANDDQGRVYWSGESHEPRMSVYATAISGPGPFPASFYMLGVPSPSAKPTLAHAGGVGAAVSRSYAYTFTTIYGEESGPSPASDVVTGKVDGTWTVGGMQTAPANSGTSSGWVTLGSGRIQATLNTAFGMQVGTALTMTYDTVELVDPIVETVRLLAVNTTTGVVEFDRGGAYPAGTTPTLVWARSSPINTAGMVKRIYRTEGTAAQYQYVAEVPVASVSYADTLTSIPGDLIATLNTQPAPAKLKCLVALPNGCLCGLTDNEVCFSDPYMPYSWPIGNRYSFVGRGVALCPVVNSVIVLTDGFPIMFTGSDPEAMSPITIETYAPCVSKRGSVNVGGGMLYPSHDGLWLATASGVIIKTRGLYRMDEWKELAPETFEAEFHDGQYYAVHTPVGGKKQILVLDIGELDSAVTVDDTADTLYRNDYDGKLYAAKGARVLKWDADEAKRYFSEWTSVEVQVDRPRNFSHAQVHADWKQVVPLDITILERNQALIAEGPDAVNGYIDGFEFNEFELNGSNLVPYNPPTERKVQFILLDENGPKFSRVVTSSRPFRLPSGFEQEVVSVGLNTSVPVFSARIAESSAELSAEP